jgi:hypothetical protein
MLHVGGSAIKIKEHFVNAITTIQGQEKNEVPGSPPSERDFKLQPQETANLLLRTAIFIPDYEPRPDSVVIEFSSDGETVMVSQPNNHQFFFWSV